MNNNRLSKNIYPTNYKLHITTDICSLTFSGKIIINIIALEQYNNFMLHCKKLSIIYISLNNNIIPQSNDNINLDDKLGLLYINKTINKGNNILEIHYNGLLNEHLEGYYKSKYTYNDIEHFIATTQFEPGCARQAFPCFDEPNFKATFDITLTSHIDKTILSNTSVVKETINHSNKTKTLVFETTPKMSSYLVAFIVGDFDYIEGTCNNILIRTYATPNNKSKLQLSLDICIRCLDYFIKWFNIDYPLKKLDMIAIPDFSANAMENWGLITYRESAMLYDEHTNLCNKQDLVNTICHELAHQWFGNLVTMEWWTYLWLNESMATYFAWLATDYIYPEWNVWTKFNEEYISALKMDSMNSSHPIEVDVNNISHIGDIFDKISYQKGSCIIKFLVDSISMSNFQKGMQKYLNQNKYNNTTSDNLWECFDNNKIKIKDIMHNLVSQMGFPLVKVERNNNKLILYQQKYSDNINHTSMHTNMILWTLPIKIKDNNNNVRTIFISDKKQEYDITDFDFNLLNCDRSCFMRVQYNELPNIKNITLNEKIGLIDDIFMLSINGYQNFNQFFILLKKLDLENETDFFIWNMVLEKINIIYDNMKHSQQIRFKYSVIKPMTKILINILNKMKNNINININGSHINESQLKIIIMKHLIKQRNKSLINNSIRLFRKNKMYNNYIPIEIIVNVIGKYGVKKDYIKLLKMYKKEKDPHIKLYILYSFAQVSRKDLLYYSLDLLLSGIIRPQDLLYYIYNMSLNKYNTNELWDYIQNNWDKFTKIFLYDSAEFTKFISSIAVGFNNILQLNKYKEFFKNNNNIGVIQTIENIENRINHKKNIRMII